MSLQARHSPRTSFLLYLGLATVFLVLVARLYQLQVVQGPSFRSAANANRLRRIDLPPPRGVIYDSRGEILARNRPSFGLAIVPEDLPADDLSTEVDERALAIRKLLLLLQADRDPEIALQLGETLFLFLGRTDFTQTLRRAGIEVTFRVVNVSVAEDTPDGPVVHEVPTIIPDLSRPLPLTGLAALLYRAVELKSQGSALEPVPILERLEREQAFAIAEELYQIPGVRVLEEPVREYPYREVVGHVLGFLGPIPAGALSLYQERGYTDINEQVGLNGLEYTYQDALRGQPGRKFVEVDILGREVRTVGQPVEPVPGFNLRLSLDIRLQEVMYEALARKAEEVNAPNAVAIAMDPKTGAILGMVSLPSFDNNIFSEGIGEDYLALEQDERRPLINYAIGGLYPPGSTFKLVSATAALAEGVITPYTVIVDNGPIYLPNRFFPDDPEQAQKFVSWNHKLGIVHGPLTVVDAMRLSNDIFFYLIGGGFPDQMKGLGEERLAKWTRLFGFGELTGIDLPGEVAAPVPDDQWKRQRLAESWTTGDSYNMAIGQGYMLATPLQVLVSTAAVANGGRVIQPRLAQELIDAEGQVVWRAEPTVIRELPVSPELLRFVQRGMWAAVNEPGGTAIASQVEGVAVAGKTGTAEFCEWDPEIEDCAYRDEEDNLPFHAWYVAYAPYEDPEIALVVFLYNGGEGSAVAVPVAQEILDAYFNRLRQ